MNKQNQFSPNNGKANIQDLKALLSNYLTGQGIDIKHNFTCLNPNHDDKNPSMVYYHDSQTVHCFGCGANYDIYDLFAIQQLHITPNADTHVSYDFKPVFNALADYMHVNVKRLKVKPEDAQAAKINRINAKIIENAKANLDQTDYLERRGISPKLAQRFGIGYIPEWVNPTIAITEGKELTPTPRLIIPTGRSSYLARDTRKNIPKAEVKYAKEKQGSAHIFNGKVLTDDTKPVFVVEGEFDALSIMQVTNNANAVALGSTSNVELFCKKLRQIKGKKLSKHEPYNPTILIAMDNDSAGQLASKELEKYLDSSQLNINNYVVNIAPDGKDANEELTTNAHALKHEVEERIKDPNDYLNGLIARIEARKDKPQYIPTGYSNLDKLLDGGLYPQLYVLGAISSIGKTTFCMQIADRIASRQQLPVFYFSLESSKDELSEKNLSRLSFELADKYRGNPQTVRSIDNGYWLNHVQEKPLMTKVFDTYKLYYPNIHIIDGTLSRPTALDIYSIMKDFRRKNPDLRPVVFVDYLQILKPIDDKDTDKEKVTKSIALFKSIASELDCPVFVISSFNRANYLNAAAMESFKESGEIEYYADTLIGLQYRIQSEDADLEQVTDSSQSKKAKANKAQKLKDARKQDPRNIELIILKNRNGRLDKSAYFDYYPKYNDFIANGLSD